MTNDPIGATGVKMLRDEIERLRAALTKIADMMPGDKFRENAPASIARAALNPKDSRDD